MKLVSAFFVLLAITPVTHAQTACHADNAPPSDADVALYRLEYGTASRLYAKAVDQNPRDIRARAGQIEARMGDGKFKEARSMADVLVATEPTEPQAHVTLADVMAAQLQMVEAAAEIRKAIAMDHCSGRALYIASIIENRNHKTASAWAHLQLAHRLSPNDDDITRAWMWNIPSEERYKQFDSYLAAPKYLKSADLDDLKGELIASAAADHSNCTVVAPKGGTTVPLQHAADRGWLQTEVYFGSTKRNFGVAANGNSIVIYEDTAKALGLKVGDHYTGHSLYQGGHFRYWTTTIPNLRVGEIEFHNCSVSVQENSSGGGFGIIGLGIFRDFLVDLDPAGTLTLSPLPPLPPSILNAAEKWSTVTSDPSGTRSRMQGIWQPFDAVVPAGMENWEHLYDVNGVKMVMTQIGPGPALPFEMSWQQHFEVLNYNYTKDAVSLLDTARILGKPIPKATLDAFGVARYFVGVQGHILPVNVWSTVTYDEFIKTRGTDLAGTLGYPTLGNLRMIADFRDGLVKFDRTTYKRFAGF